MNKPTISEAWESLKSVEETARERIVKHVATAAACAVVAVFAIRCADRYWNESDFAKAVAACDINPVLTVDQVGPGKTQSKDIVLAATQAKNACVKDVLGFYQKTASLRPVITIDKDDVVR